MKIPSSSSMIFATLAISASSTSLAAPTNGDTPNAEATLTSSPSGNRIASRRDSFARGVRPTNMQQEIDLARSVTENDGLEARGFLDPLLGGILCPLVTPILDCREPAGAKKEKAGKQSQSTFEAGPSTSMSSEEAIQRFESAIAIIKAQQASDPSYTPSDDSNSSPDGSRSGDDSGAGGDSWDAHVGVGDDDSTPQDNSDSTAAAAEYDPATPSPPPNTPDMSSSAAPSSSVWVPSSSASAEPTDIPARRDLLPSDISSSAEASSSVSVAPSSTTSSAPSFSSSVASSSSASAEPTDTLARRDSPPSSLPVSAPVAVPTVVSGAAGQLPVEKVTGHLPVDVSPANGATNGAPVVITDTEKLVQDAVGLAGSTRRRGVDPPVQAPGPVAATPIHSPIGCQWQAQ
ncbi:hypothetical protein C8F04DRAFT_162819 [Mycena alexandri]|uniref:Uncharacterized protein n=1 Tax=Mycena alexandri TaxID=1745969 RepID=A0AAD6WTJ7_9AGAR|nr:hypothetical protein C8F04DRAFT_162819 [Mycena alexandri]